MKKILISIAASVAILAACSENNSQRAADNILNTAEKDFSEGQYDMAMKAIDSLRKEYPTAVETRKKALKLYQNAALKEAQADLALTDQKMQEAIKEYDIKKKIVDKAKAELKASAEELDALTKMKMRLDSLQVRFDTQCAKIKYIHKKQKE